MLNRLNALLYLRLSCLNSTNIAKGREPKEDATIICHYSRRMNWKVFFLPQ